MTGRQVIGAFRAVLFVSIVVCLAPLQSRAAPYADMVMDARSGEVLHSTNADSRLHPASLTKMMTLYIAFEAIRMGEISLDTQVTISRKAASEPPSKLGLRAGQRIELRYLIRAAAVKSANDAATAIGEAIEGSEAAFARRMNRTARALGMTRTTFKNANGLTEEGHLSTARDMTILGRHLFYDYPQYYNIFSRRSTNAGGTEVANTNRRFLDAYEGADGIKTGYTSAAGFNLVASAERGRERIIATVFGGSSTANRNARMAELLDFGFDRAPTRVAVNRPQLPRYDAVPDDDAPAAALVAEAGSVPEGMSTKIVRVSGAIAQSPRPRPRGGAAADEPPVELLAAIEANVADAIAAAAAEAAAQSVSESVAAGVASEVALALAETSVAAEPEAEAPAMAGPPARPEDLVPATDEVEVSAADLAAETIEPATDEAAADAAAAPEVPADETEILVAEAVTEEAAPGAGAPEALSLVADVAPAPGAEPDLDLVSIRPADILGPELAAGALPDFAPAPEPEAVLLAAAVAPPLPPEPTIRPEPVSAEIVTRLSTSGGRHYGVSLGRFGTRTEAEKALITMSLSDMAGLGGALRRVVQRSGGFEANFMGMSEEEAALACRRMLARGLDCAPIGG